MHQLKEPKDCQHYFSLLMSRGSLGLVLKLFACVLFITTLAVFVAVIDIAAYTYPSISTAENVAGLAELQRHLRVATVLNEEPVPADELATKSPQGLVERFETETKRSNCSLSRCAELRSLTQSTKGPPCTAASILGCVTNDPFRDPMLQVSTTPLQCADANPLLCPERLCFNFALANKKRNTCWNAAKKSTALDDKEFHCRFMNGTGRVPVGLVSFPGSGNTWARGLLEQVTGLCTGSIYCDIGLLEKGFAGENIQNGAVLVVKSHAILPLWLNESVTVISRRPHFSGIIFILRNLFDALEAEMNRQVYDKHHQGSQSWRSHVSTAGDLRFGRNKVWTKFVHSRAPQWLAMIRNWIAGNRGHPVLVIRYEDMKLSPVREVKKMLRFLNVEYNDDIVEKRLRQDFSIYHRHKKQNRDVYSKQLRAFVNSVLSDAEKYVSDNGLEDVVQISDYHR